MSAPRTVGAAVAEARRRLAAAGIEAAGLDARLLCADTLGCDMAAVIGHPERTLDAAGAARFDAAVQRRLRREPLAYVLGKREFWSLSLRVSGATLIPRPDSEVLVEAALSHAGVRHRALSILDLGTGSGCLLIALLCELPDGRGVGVDRSAAALTIARDNAERCGVGDRAAFVRADWAEAIAGSFDLVVANPPYVADREWQRLPPDVRDFEPPEALRAGADGLAAYRRILAALPGLLAVDGAAFVEVGGASAAGVPRLARRAGLQAVETRRDLGNRPRCLGLRRANTGAAKKFLGNQAVPV